MTETISERILQAMRSGKWTLAVAESCTGGLIGGMLTDAAGASEYFFGGVIAYANSVKRDLLKVPQDTLNSHGAVSEETALAMAIGIRSLLGADFGLSTTGIAGPGGGTPGKPVGTVWLGFSASSNSCSKLLQLHGSRDQIRRGAANAALEFLLNQL